MYNNYNNYYDLIMNANGDDYSFYHHNGYDGQQNEYDQANIDDEEEMEEDENGNNDDQYHPNQDPNLDPNQDHPEYFYPPLNILDEKVFDYLDNGEELYQTALNDQRFANEYLRPSIFDSPPESFITAADYEVDNDDYDDQ